MNYMPSGTISQTSCKDCIFAIYDNDTQIDCEADRINKFGDSVFPAYDDHKEFFVINKVCTLHRPSRWNNGNKDLEKAKKEIELTFDILVDCDNVTDEMINKIGEIVSMSSNKISVRLFHSHEISEDKKTKIKNLIYTFSNINISMYFNKEEYIYSIISKSKNLFHIIIDQKNCYNLKDFISNINNMVIENLTKGIIFKHDDKIAISTMACRLLYPNLYVDFTNNYQVMEEQIKNSNLYVEW